MLALNTLRAAAREALAFVSAQPEVAEAEVFVASDANLTVRLNYTSHIPSSGVEEPKSTENHGLGIRAVFHSPGGEISTPGRLIGFGSEPSDLSLAGAARALSKARAAAVFDAEFVSLPRPEANIPAPPAPTVPPGAASGGYDPAVMRVGSRRLLGAGWQLLEQALDAFQSSEDLLSLAGGPDGVAGQGLILGGDAVLLQSRMAVASTHLPRVQTDQNTLIMSFATAMVERQESKGSGWSVSSQLADFDGRSAAEAARNSVAAVGLEYGGSRRAPTGRYRVVLGPQPVTEILEWVLLPGLQLEMFYAGASPFLGKLGREVLAPSLSIYEDSGQPGLPGSRRITDEGLPAGRTELIRQGQLAGLLADYYNYQRMLHAPDARQKLGCAPQDARAAIAPRCGFRPGNGGGRNFAAPPGIVPCNLVVEGQDGLPNDELLRRVGNGIYIGRIWYTYPVNGITSGDFSGTIIGDSYLIENGRLTAPIKPNTLRMNDNALRALNEIIAIGAARRPTVRWSSDQITWAPEIAIDNFQLEEI